MSRQEMPYSMCARDCISYCGFKEFIVRQSTFLCISRRLIDYGGLLRAGVPAAHGAGVPTAHRAGVPTAHGLVAC
jgi:hypothetical protein